MAEISVASRVIPALGSRDECNLSDMGQPSPVARGRQPSIGGAGIALSKDDFPELTKRTELALPSEVGANGAFDLEDRAVKETGADCLWFAFTKDVLKELGVSKTVNPKCGQVKESERNYNKGFSETDAPFVAEGVKMVRSGEARNPSRAARLLVERYGETSGEDQPPGSKKIQSQAIGNAEERLRKKISNALKKSGS